MMTDCPTQLSDDEILRRGLLELIADAIGVAMRGDGRMTPALEQELDEFVKLWASRFMVRPEVAAEVRGGTISPFFGTQR
jgi:hypothetical protein